MLRRRPNGMRLLEHLADMQVKDLSFFRHHLQCRMLSRGPNGMKPLEILAGMPGEGLEPKSHHLKRHHKLPSEKGSQWHEAPGASSRDAGLGLEPNSHHSNATISSC